MPSFAAEVLRDRLSATAERGTEALLFSSRNGTPLSPANVANQLRRVLKRAGIEGVSLHKFRRTVATVTNSRVGVDLAAELLGRSDPRIAVQYYIHRNEMVDPATTDVLEQAFRQGTSESGA